MTVAFNFAMEIEETTLLALGRAAKLHNKTSSDAVKEYFRESQKENQPLFSL